MYDALWVELTFFDLMKNFLMYSRFMSIVDFPVSGLCRTFDQYIQYMSDTRDVCQKPEIHSDTHIRKPMHDEMGGTSIAKSKVSDMLYRRFHVLGSIYFGDA